MVAFSTWWDAHLGDSPCRKWYDLLSEWFMPLVIERSCHTWEKGCLSGAEGSSTCPWHCFCWTSVNQQSSPFHIPPHLPSRHTCYIFSFYLSKTQLNCYSPWASTGLHEGKRYQCHSCMGKNNPQKGKKKEGGGEERKKPEAEYAYMFAISSIFWGYFSFSLFVSFYSVFVSLHTAVWSCHFGNQYRFLCECVFVYMIHEGMWKVKSGGFAPLLPNSFWIQIMQKLKLIISLSVLSYLFVMRKAKRFVFIHIGVQDQDKEWILMAQFVKG